MRDYSFAMFYHPFFRARVQYAGRNFALLTSYPSKELTDGAATISGAGLLNAALLQRLK